MKDNLPERERGVKDHDPAGGSKNNNPEAKTKPLPDLMTNKGGGWWEGEEGKGYPHP